MTANEVGSATRRTGRNDCKHDVPAGLAATHGYAAQRLDA